MIVRTRLGVVGCDIAGDGVPLVWLHGYPLDRTLWAPQLAAALPGVRQVAPDLPGFGGSARLPERSFDAWADWVAALLDALAIERCILGGLSMGGYLAFACWRRHPSRIRALVLADTRAGQDSAEARARREENQRLLETQGVGALAERLLPGMVGRTTRRERPEVPAALDAMMRRADPAAVADAREALIGRDDSAPSLPTITVPTLVLCGDEDALTPLAESRALADAIPGARLAVVPQAGHCSNLEQPAVFNALLSEFLVATIRTHPT